MHNFVFCFARRALLFAPLLLLCTAPLVGCGGGGDSGPINYQSNGSSGIRGTAYTQNADGTKTPYVNGMVAATVTHCPVDSNGHNLGAACSTENVVTTQTDAQGRFTLPLIRGQYGFAFVQTSDTAPRIYTTQPFITVNTLQFTSADVVGMVVLPLTTNTP